jgi:hypothetical protein
MYKKRARDLDLFFCFWKFDDDDDDSFDGNASQRDICVYIGKDISQHRYSCLCITYSILLELYYHYHTYILHSLLPYYSVICLSSILDTHQTLHLPSPFSTHTRGQSCLHSVSVLIGAFIKSVPSQRIVKEWVY